MEIKYHMQKGAGMVYSWKATGNVAFEFHGEPDNKPNKDYFESYELNDKVGRGSLLRLVHRAQHRYPRLVLGKQR